MPAPLLHPLASQRGDAGDCAIHAHDHLRLRLRLELNGCPAQDEPGLSLVAPASAS